MRLVPVGPKNAKIVIVGEAPGEQEEKLGQPFVGKSGQLLTSVLKSVGINRNECYITNVFLSRPKDNKIELFFGPKKEGCSDLAPLKPGKYILPQFRPEVERLKAELSEVRPNLIIALGATATWALLGNSKIGQIRGNIHESPFGKVLPAFHPAAVLRQYELLPILTADLMKAEKESHFPEIRRVFREIWLDPKIEDLYEFERKYIRLDELAPPLAFDIETPTRLIDCIGFAPDPAHAIVVPFTDFRKPGNSYWPDLESEVAAWNWVRKILESPCPKVGQNGVYDISHLWWQMGIRVFNYRHDTMLLHHSLQPEMPKGLGFLGSIYCNEVAWKDIRKIKDEDKEDE